MSFGLAIMRTFADVRAEIVSFALTVSTCFIGLVTVFFSQASSPNYRDLFWFVLCLAGIQVAFAVGCIRSINATSLPHWPRRVVGFMTIVTLAALAELFGRAWL